MSNARTIQAVVIRSLREAAWAPIAVLILHAIVVRTSYRTELDHLLHFLGGAAIAFFLFRCIGIAADLLGVLRKVTHYLFAFALASTIAVLWEIAEFFSDRLLVTELQKSLSETMGDLIAGLVGAASALGVVALVYKSR
jgi:hypothetical protein